MLLKELIRNGYSIENNTRVWDISKRYFRFINKEMADAFLQLRNHPRYKATIMDIELKLIKEHASNLLEYMKDCQFNLIDTSCTDGTKAKAIISSLPNHIKLRYCPVGVNSYFVNLATKNVKIENFQNVTEYAPRIAENFESIGEMGAALRNSKYQKNVFLLLGSFLGSFEINNYLFGMSQSMLPGDILLIGNGIRKGERFSNLEAYKNTIFNNWLIHLMKQLDFKENEVEYDARFAHNRLEIYYKIKVDKTFEYEKRKINIKKGDEIIVAFQYKLYANELRDFCDMYFDNVQLVQDSDEEYALVLCKR